MNMNELEKMVKLAKLGQAVLDLVEGQKVKREAKPVQLDEQGNPIVKKRGRPRKNPVDANVAGLDSNNGTKAEDDEAFVAPETETEAEETL